ncbi:hypothetical protein B0A48_17133 [Cryoendolithus antarcticus]|uniref:Uncharacterized protein n=1 Tax=Cryoendolithus antarcticus TaxID=1507870 RepID=A0A1V8SCB6_9PEZI|nr:hypothetical protein B0A48_17133 [Cryoendolithus antarcticus]
MASSTATPEFFNLTFPGSHTAVVEINRPSKLNAFTEPMFHSLGQIFSSLSTNPEVRCIILTAAGTRAFTAGLDVTAASTSGPLANTPSNVDPARKAFRLRRHILDLQGCVTEIEKATQPVIGVFHGISYGLAIDVATCCDIRICSADVRFAVKEVDIGLAADVGTLTRIVKAGLPMSFVKDVCLTARDFGAQEALRVGFVSEICEGKDAAVARAKEIAAVIGSKSPVAVGTTKEVVNFSRDHSVEDGLNYIAIYNAAMLQTKDVDSAMLAGIRKTKPTFSKL